MENFQIKLKIDPRAHQEYGFSRPAEIIGNNEGLFINSRKVTDIFYNGIQIRLYVAGSFKGINEGDNEFYFIFNNNENDLNLSLDDLNTKLEKAFVG